MGRAQLLDIAQLAQSFGHESFIFRPDDLLGFFRLGSGRLGHNLTLQLVFLGFLHKASDLVYDTTGGG